MNRRSLVFVQLRYDIGGIFPAGAYIVYNVSVRCVPYSIGCVASDDIIAKRLFKALIVVTHSDIPFLAQIRCIGGFCASGKADTAEFCRSITAFSVAELFI